MVVKAWRGEGFSEKQKRSHHKEQLEFLNTLFHYYFFDRDESEFEPLNPVSKIYLTMLSVCVLG